jgi:hypothetical protein
MEKSQTNSKLPEELEANYRISHKGSSILEGLKAAAVLKLWEDRGFRDVPFDVPFSFGGRRVFVKVLARNAEGVVLGLSVLRSQAGAATKADCTCCGLFALW